MHSSQKPTTYYFECSCMSPEHTIRFVIDEWEEEKDIDMYCEVQLSQYRNIFKRIWIAIKYIFGYKCKYGHWDCWLIKSEDAEVMKNMIDKYIQIKSKYGKDKEQCLVNPKKCNKCKTTPKIKNDNNRWIFSCECKNINPMILVGHVEKRDAIEVFNSLYGD